MTSSNGNNGDLLDRIERLLESIAQRTDSNARTLQAIASFSSLIYAIALVAQLRFNCRLLIHLEFYPSDRLHP